MEKNIVTIDRPIDPSEMDDDRGGAAVSIPAGGGDPSKIVHDVTADPRGPGYAAPRRSSGGRRREEQRVDTGPQVVPLSAEQAEQAELATWVAEMGVAPEEVGLPSIVPTPAPTPGPDAVRAAPTPRAAQAAPGDAIIERARQRAFKALAALPSGLMLVVGGEALDPVSGVEIVMGLGLLSAQGLATCAGGAWRLTPEGRKQGRP